MLDRFKKKPKLQSYMLRLGDDVIKLHEAPVNQTEADFKYGQYLAYQALEVLMFSYGIEGGMERPSQDYIEYLDRLNRLNSFSAVLSAPMVFPRNNNEDKPKILEIAQYLTDNMSNKVEPKYKLGYVSIINDILKSFSVIGGKYGAISK